MIYIPAPQAYVAFAEAPATHSFSESESATSVHSSSSSHEEPSNSFSNYEDTNGIRTYRATYPYWVYAAHPSTECTTDNKNCPPTDPAQLAKYNKQQHEQAVLFAWVTGGLLLFVAVAIAFGAYASTKV